VDARPAKEQVQQAIREKLGLRPAGSQVPGTRAAGKGTGT
jgi:hypothetical protein